MLLWVAPLVGLAWLLNQVLLRLDGQDARIARLENKV